VKLSPSQRARVDAYERLLGEFAPRLGLLSDRDVGRLRTRHIDDSLRAADHFSPAERLAYDLGSGSGLPGMVLAIAVPSCRFRLVESRRRRVGFLEMAVERLGLENAEVHVGRAEELREPGDVVTARAFASLPATWRIAWPILRPGGRLIFFSGRGVRRGDAEALRDPAPPGGIELAEGLANQGPLVIMARG
jgi:16S rRNA (guanine527-N7)-methyltransferase